MQEQRKVTQSTKKKKNLIITKILRSIKTETADDDTATVLNMVFVHRGSIFTAGNSRSCRSNHDSPAAIVGRLRLRTAAPTESFLLPPFFVPMSF